MGDGEKQRKNTGVLRSSYREKWDLSFLVVEKTGRAETGVVIVERNGIRHAIFGVSGWPVILKPNCREKWDETAVVVGKNGTFFGRVNCESKICFLLIVERKGIFRPNYRGERDKSSVMVEENGTKNL